MSSVKRRHSICLSLLMLLRIKGLPFRSIFYIGNYFLPCMADIFEMYFNRVPSPEYGIRVPSTRDSALGFHTRDSDSILGTRIPYSALGFHTRDSDSILGTRIRIRYSALGFNTRHSDNIIGTRILKPALRFHTRHSVFEFESGRQTQLTATR